MDALTQEIVVILLLSILACVLSTTRVEPTRLVRLFLWTVLMTSLVWMATRGSLFVLDGVK
jgi:hypothetical protein